MARKMVEVALDDLDGSPATHTEVLGYRGVLYRLDLNDGNAARLQEALAPFLVDGLTVLGRSNGNPRSYLTDEESARIVEHEDTAPVAGSPASAPTPRQIAERLGAAAPHAPEPDEGPLPVDEQFPPGKDPTVVAIEEYSKSAGASGQPGTQAADVPETGPGDAGEPVQGAAAATEETPEEEAVPVRDTSGYRRIEVETEPDMKDVRRWAISTDWRNPRTGRLLSDFGRIPDACVAEYKLAKRAGKDEQKALTGRAAAVAALQKVAAPA